MNFRRRGVLIAFAVLALRASTLAYGPLGHEIVGAIADERLANTPTAAKIRALLDGLTLEKAAVIVDEIKGWDKKGVDDPKSFHFSAHWKIDRQLRDFWRANQPTHEMNSAAPSHHWFHYTDVPVVPPQAYHEGAAGRSKWDIVHMIPYCIQVLQGTSARAKRAQNYQAGSASFAGPLCRGHLSAAACRRGIFRCAGPCDRPG